MLAIQEQADFHERRPHRNSLVETNVFATRIKRSKLSPAMPIRIVAEEVGRFWPLSGMADRKGRTNHSYFEVAIPMFPRFMS
jgi:hypothetical protein